MTPFDITSLLGSEHFAIMKAAKKAGMDLVAVDGVRFGSRDQTMATNIEKILQQDPNNKVVYWVGSHHLKQGGSEISAFDMLAKHYRVTSFFGTNPLVTADSLAKFTSDIKKPVSIAIEQAPLTKDIPTNLGTFGAERHQVYNNAILFPRLPLHATQSLLLTGASYLNPLWTYTLARAVVAELRFKQH